MKKPAADHILASLPSAIMILDEKRQIINANPASEVLVGTSAKNMLGKKIDSFIRFSSDRLQHALIHGEPSFTANRMGISIGGRKTAIFDFDIRSVAQSPDYSIVTMSQFMDDEINDEPGPGQGENAIRAPDILSHEIKNPLAAIKGAAQLLSRRLDDKQRKMTQLIEHEVARITKLMDRMQILSAMRPTEFSQINIHSVIDQARLSLEAAQDGKIAVENNFDPSLPDVMVDPDSMLQVLTNLLSNALYALQDVENPVLRVSTRYSFGTSFAAGGDGQRVKLPIEIMISDNGPGVPPALESDIFSPFVSTKREGQGLGLALCRKLIHDMNGRIKYHRDGEKKLTNFTLFLPVAAAEGAVQSRNKEGL